ncbi:MAG: purine-nucleoside phosphorylase [Clostridiales bacterium]|nr:purine-nucleoside phosphorylase [Clostridiales bacterium]
MMQTIPLERYEKSASYIREKIGGAVPETAVILGTCLGPLAEEIEEPVVIDYTDIPGFLVSTVASHAGKLIYGMLSGKRILCMSGRFHYYEGYDFNELSIPIRVFHLLGVKQVILTNAAGAINYNYKPGDICVIKDHINLCGASPCRGQNLEEFGERFYSVNGMYDQKLRELAKSCAVKLGFSLQEGNYFFAPGPHYETPAEIRAMRLLGGDMVGMSTVTEALTAAHCGMKVLCLSLATNLSADRTADPDEGIDKVSQMVSGRFGALLREIVRQL